MQVWLRSSSVSYRTCRSCALLSVYLLLAHVACRLAHLILLHFLGLAIAAALALVVGEVAVLAVGHLVSADRSTFSDGKIHKAARWSLNRVRLRGHNNQQGQAREANA